MSQFRDLCSGPAWLELEREEVAALLVSDGLVAGEDQVLTTLLAWSAAREEDGLPDPELLQLIRFPLLSVSLLGKLEAGPGEQLGRVRECPAYLQFCAAQARATTWPAPVNIIQNLAFGRWRILINILCKM